MYSLYINNVNGYVLLDDSTISYSLANVQTKDGVDAEDWWMGYMIYHPYIYGNWVTQGRLAMQVPTYKVGAGGAISYNVPSGKTYVGEINYNTSSTDLNGVYAKLLRYSTDSADTYGLKVYNAANQLAFNSSNERFVVIQELSFFVDYSTVALSTSITFGEYPSMPVFILCANVSPGGFHRAPSGSDIYAVKPWIYRTGDVLNYGADVSYWGSSLDYWSYPYNNIIRMIIGIIV